MRPLHGGEGVTFGDLVTLGLAPSTYGVAVVARTSQKQVVNLAQRGGMCALLTGSPPDESSPLDTGA